MAFVQSGYDEGADSADDVVIKGSVCGQVTAFFISNHEVAIIVDSPLAVFVFLGAACANVISPSTFFALICNLLRLQRQIKRTFAPNIFEDYSEAPVFPKAAVQSELRLHQGDETLVPFAADELGLVNLFLHVKVADYNGANLAGHEILTRLRLRRIGNVHAQLR